VANSNRKCNKVENLVINGDISSNSDEVKDQAFKEREVFEVVKDLNGDKAPGSRWFFLWLSSSLVGMLSK
jgi:hypothetical protein